MTAKRSPRILVSKFLMPKEGAGAEECEDAFGVNAEALRFAVADGATEAFDAGSWARTLARGWAGARAGVLTPGEFRAWVAEEGARLRGGWEGRKLPWYAEEKARAGSFAAFVGLAFEAGPRGLRWSALAVGDSCLVRRRGGRVRASLPLSSHTEFNSCPVLVPTHEAALDAALQHLQTAGGAAERGDTFLLLSDAAAAWFLEQSAAGAARVEEFDSRLAASDNEALAELLRAERRAGRLKDDDVAAVRVAVGAD
jgi:hypothetical protein